MRGARDERVARRLQRVAVAWTPLHEAAAAADLAQRQLRLPFHRLVIPARARGETRRYAAGLQAASKAPPAVRARTSAPDAWSTCTADGEGWSPLGPFTDAM